MNDFLNCLKGQNRKRNGLLYICILFLFIQCLFLIYFNLTRDIHTIDRDSAEVFVHAMEMWRNKKVLIPDWTYTTTLEWDCSLLLAVPRYYRKCLFVFWTCQCVFCCCLDMGSVSSL